MSRKTLIIGASKESYRYSNRLMRLLDLQGISVIGLGAYDADIEGGKIYSERKDFEDIHTVSIYLRKELQEDMHDYILSLNPSRIIFNPGAENPGLAELAGKKGIETLNACSIVMLNTGQY